ncbi:hypothetical protein Egran_06843 [Elaphomyces granulatus]|uniref:Uncharacterized protein n=1 Tax=Elaphomyces granulatus TaxID=519963 RepID=A0A232LML4_9EURO|nr:hypothetical protein Egran_06843 [Elaphomyces granulatus]
MPGKDPRGYSDQRSKLLDEFDEEYGDEDDGLQQEVDRFRREMAKRRRTCEREELESIFGGDATFDAPSSGTYAFMTTFSIVYGNDLDGVLGGFLKLVSVIGSNGCLIHGIIGGSPAVIDGMEHKPLTAREKSCDAFVVAPTSGIPSPSPSDSLFLTSITFPNLLTTVMPFSRRLYARSRVSRLADKPAELIASVEKPEPFDELPIFEDEQGDIDLEFSLDDSTLNDLDEKIDPHDAKITNLPIELDLQELQHADQCDNYIAVTNEVDPALNALPIQPFNSEEEMQAIQSTGISSQTIPTSPMGHLDVQASGDDDSELIKHVRATDRDPSRFRVALGLWCQEAGISRSLYSSLLEIRMPELQQEVHRLPSCLSTLKRQTTAQLLLLSMRKKSLQLQPEQLGKEKSAAGLSSIGLREDLYFFDPIAVFTAFLRSDISNQMYFDLGDNPKELWHSHAWRSSIRTSSGQFAHYPDGKPIFPSDFIFFRCHDYKCTRGCSKPGDPSSVQRQHVGRVHSVGRDFRSSIRRQAQGVITVEVQEVLGPKDLQGVNLQPPLLQNEGLLSWNKFHYLTEDHVNSRILCVFLDYYFFDDRLDPDRPRPSAPPDALLIRRIHDVGPDPGNNSSPSITPLCKSHPLRGELELEAYGRAHFEQFDRVRTVSLPLLTFIDGFGLYRNAYRTFMGMYFNFASLSFHERTRRANVIPITLGPSRQ